jgi:hypothetical protein
MGDHFMRKIPSAGIIAALFGCVFASGDVKAQSIHFYEHSISLKSGESSEIAQVYYIGKACQSLLKGSPEVEIMQGPPGVTATIREEKVVPRDMACANPVPGGKLIISASDIDDYSRTRMVVRIKLKTSEGERQRTRDINISLFPPQ